MTLNKNLKILRFGLGLLLITSLLIMLISWRVGAPPEYLLLDKGILSLIIFLFYLPIIYLHTQYFIQNIKTTLVIDNKNNCLTISEGNETYQYDFTAIELSIVYRGIYYKNKIDNKYRRKTIFSDYGYWVVKFRDGNTFHFTSLMLDTNQLPFIEKTKVKYVFFPYLRRNLKTQDDIKNGQRNNYENGVLYFQNKFDNYDSNQLEKIINNQKSYEDVAIEACKRILLSRTTNV